MYVAEPYYFSQGSCLVFQTMVFQLIFATLNMFFRENSNSSQKIENPGGPHSRPNLLMIFLP